MATAPVTADKPLDSAKEKVSTAIEAVKTAAQEDMIPKAKLDEALDRIKQYESTIKALENATHSGQMTQSQANAAGNRVLDQLDGVIDNVSRQLGGADKGEVGQWVRFLNVVLGELTRPYVTALAGLADKFDGLDARTEIADYNDYSQDIEREREVRAGRGEYLSRKEAYHLVRSRNIPALLEKERQKMAADLQKETADAQSASAQGADLGTTQKAGPSPTKESSKLSKDEFAKLPLEEQEKMLESVSF